MADRSGATLASLLAIVVAGGVAAVLAWWIVASLGIAGFPGALLTVTLAMVLALGLFALGALIAKRILGGRE